VGRTYTSQTSIDCYTRDTCQSSPVMDGLDTMSDLLASLPGLGSVGGPGPLSREADERTFESALDALARAAGWPCEVRWALLALLWRCDLFWLYRKIFAASPAWKPLVHDQHSYASAIRRPCESGTQTARSSPHPRIHFCCIIHNKTQALLTGCPMCAN
jgi:hypothetical protein